MTLLEDPTLLVTVACGWEGEARRELRLLLPGARVESLFIAGNLIAVLDGDLRQALARLAEERTYTIGRVTPVHLRCQVGPDCGWLAVMREAAGHLPPPDPELRFRVACDRRGRHEFTSADVERAVADAWVHGGTPPVDLEEPEQVLSVEIYQDLCFMGMNPAGRLVRKTVRRQRRWAPGERPISRAELKLREAIEEFGLELPREGRALDLGAAPGGWTRVLAEQMAEVVAVDPGELDERVSELSNVTHLRRRAGELAAEEVGRFDVMTNDMNLSPLQSAGLMCEMAELLAPRGIAVMTVKFMTRDRSRHIAEAVHTLQTQYEEIEVSHMPHNAKETTAMMRRRA